MKQPVWDKVLLPSKTVFMPVGNREQLLSLAYTLRQADLHLLAPEALGVPLRVDRQWIDTDTLEERHQGDLTLLGRSTTIRRPLARLRAFFGLIFAPRPA